MKTAQELMDNYNQLRAQGKEVKALEKLEEWEDYVCETGSLGFCGLAPLGLTHKDVCLDIMHVPPRIGKMFLQMSHGKRKPTNPPIKKNPNEEEKKENERAIEIYTKVLSKTLNFVACVAVRWFALYDSPCRLF